MKKSFFISAIILVAGLCLSAQTKVGKYKDWKKTIDQLEVKAPYDFSSQKTVVVLPVRTADVKLPDKDDDNYALVTKMLGKLTDMIAGEMQKNLQKKGYKVIVADDADYRNPDAIVLQLNWNEFDLGNRALRYWVGFGAGNASFGTEGEIYDGDKLVITFNHRRITPMDARQNEKVAEKAVKNLSEDFAKMILEL